jgi:signal transduction histidine kinase
VELESRHREAEEAKRARHEMIANVSHELRTPLTAIMGYAYLLKEGTTGSLDEAQLAGVRRIEDAGRRLGLLIDGLLDLTQVKLGRVNAEPNLCDGVELARTALASAPAPASGVSMELDAQMERAPIHTDPLLVLRILQSLLSNAVKFTQAGSITLAVRTETPAASSEHLYFRGQDVVWEVIDTGIGIDSAHHALIFEELRQADGSATRRFEGAGIGLSLARGLARALRGDLTVMSRLGKGSTFRLTLPSSVVHAGTV